MKRLTVKLLRDVDGYVAGQFVTTETEQARGWLRAGAAELLEVQVQAPPKAEPKARTSRRLDVFGYSAEAEEIKPPVLPPGGPGSGADRGHSAGTDPTT